MYGRLGRVVANQTRRLIRRELKVVEDEIEDE